jgi:hypothetical protein
LSRSFYKIKSTRTNIAGGFLFATYAYLAVQVQVLSLQFPGVHVLALHVHFFEHVFTQVLPLQQLLTFVLSPAIAASDNNTAVLAIKILRFILFKFNIYYSVN